MGSPNPATPASVDDGTHDRGTQREAKATGNRGTTANQKSLAQRAVADPALRIDPGRTVRQRERAKILRGVESSLREAFDLTDAALPATTLFEPMRRVRDNVHYDMRSEIDDAMDALDVLELALSPQPRTTIRADHGFHAAVTMPYPEFVQDRLERATLTAHLLPIYASLAAVERALEIDRIGTAAQQAVWDEALGYARAFTQLADPKAGRPELARVRSLVPAAVAHTKMLLTTLEKALAQGEHAWRYIESALRVIDVPLEFAQGVVVPWQAALGSAVVAKSGFVLAHQKEFSALSGSIVPFLAELRWIYGNAPAMRRYAFNPLLWQILKESGKSIRAEEVAFAIGRVVKHVIEHSAKQAAAGEVATLTWKLITWYIIEVSGLVAALDSPTFTSRGLARLAGATPDRILAAIGGESDPYAIVAKVNEILHASLTAPEVAAVLSELLRSDVQQHVRSLADATAVVGPNIAAIIIDLTAANGPLSEATAKSAQQVTGIELLPPAP